MLEEYNLTVALSTIVSWWSPKTLSEIENVASDRLNVEDTRINHKQRPDVLVDTERVLYRKVVANKGTGLPYTKTVMQLLAINIFNKLCSLNLYNESGQRKSPNIEVGEEILQAVQYPLLAHKYLARNNKKTEWHKSCNVRHNVSLGRTVPKPC